MPVTDSTPAPPPQGYGNVARLLHWLFVVLILVQAPVGIAMTSEAVPALGDTLFILHKGLGSILLVLIVLRVLWRLTHPVPALLPHRPALQRRIAACVHWLLYALLLLMPISGYIRTVGDNFPIELLDALGIPPLVSNIPDTAHVMQVLHKFGAFALTALVAAHVGAVVHQGLIERDPVMSRIWPPLRRRPSGTDGHR